MFLLLININWLFLCYVLRILVMINGEWLVLFTSVWTPYLPMTEVARLTAFGVFMAPTAASRKHCA